jgi:hypothetical protein
VGCKSVDVAKLAVQLLQYFKSFPDAHSALSLNELVQAFAEHLVFLQVADKLFGLRQHQHEDVG